MGCKLKSPDLIRLQLYLSIADTLYSGHFAIADKIRRTRQNPYVFLMKKPLYSGHGYSGHLAIADSFYRPGGQFYLSIADTMIFLSNYSPKK